MWVIQAGGFLQLGCSFLCLHHFMHLRSNCLNPQAMQAILLVSVILLIVLAILLASGWPYLNYLFYHLPWQEDNAVFVMTNMIISPDQKQATCPEDPSFEGVKCSSDSDCTPLEPVPNGHGKPHMSCSVVVLKTAVYLVWSIDSLI